MKKIFTAIAAILTITAYAQHDYDDQGVIYSIDENVGIGTSAPEVSADISTSGSMLLPNNSGTTNTAIIRIGYANHSWAGGQLDMGIYNYSVSGYPAWIQARNPADYSVNRNLLLNPNGGNIGIGTTSPQAKADITTSGSMQLPNNSGSTNTAILRIGYSNQTWAGVQLDMGIYNHSTNATTGYPAWIQARNPTDYSENRNLLLNPNGGNIGIGTISPVYKLDVLGTIRAEEIKVDLDGADFVFKDDYDLRTLDEVEDFVKENKHLPEIEPASEMEANGTDLGELNTKLLQKIEELTLYMIEMNSRVNSLETENSELKEKIETLEAK